MPINRNIFDLNFNLHLLTASSNSKDDQYLPMVYGAALLICKAGKTVVTVNFKPFDSIEPLFAGRVTINLIKTINQKA